MVVLSQQLRQRAEPGKRRRFSNLQVIAAGSFGCTMPGVREVRTADSDTEAWEKQVRNENDVVRVGWVNLS